MAAALSSLGEQIKEELTCGMCKNIFTQPKVLPCQHTFCQDCLKHHAGGGGTFPCPECQREVSVPPQGVDSLPDNNLVASLCLHVRNQQQQPPTVQEAKGQSGIKCSFHPSEELRLFCKPCKVPICLECLEDAHDGHVTTTLKKAVQERTVTVKAIVTTTRELLDARFTLLHTLRHGEKTLHDQRHQANTSIDGVYDKILQKITKAKEQMKSEIEHNHLQNMAAVMSQRDSVLAEVSELFSACDRAEQEMSDGVVKFLGQDTSWTLAVEKYSGTGALTPVQMQIATFHPSKDADPSLGHVSVPSLSSANSAAVSAVPEATDNSPKPEGHLQGQGQEQGQVQHQGQAIGQLQVQRQEQMQIHVHAQGQGVTQGQVVIQGQVVTQGHVVTQGQVMTQGQMVAQGLEVMGQGHAHVQGQTSQIQDQHQTQDQGQELSQGPVVGTFQVHGQYRAQRVTFNWEGSGYEKFKTGPFGLAVWGGELFVEDLWNKRVLVFTLQGAFVGGFPTTVLQGLKMEPENVAVDRQGHLWVAGGTAAVSSSLVQYNKQGRVLSAIDLPFTRRKRGLAVDTRRNHVLVTHCTEATPQQDGRALPQDVRAEVQVSGQKTSRSLLG
ncbi:uncharacterized protein LOC144875360 [Branchiostoma floridae x Branchiostoma japonicum]